MTDDEYQVFVDRCFDELEAKQQHLVDHFGFGNEENRVRLDVGGAKILFFTDDELRVTARIVPIGSFHEPSGSWMWGWANDEFGEPLQRQSSRLMDLAQHTDRKLFITETIPADPSMIWELAGIALWHLQADGCYRVPSGEVLYFYALLDLDKAA